MIRAWVGWVVYVPFSMFCDFCFWSGMVLNQRQLSVVVPDWEPYLGSLGSLLSCGWFFSVSVSTWNCFGFVISRCRLLFCSLFLLKTKVNTYHTGYWSDPCYSSEEEEDHNNILKSFCSPDLEFLTIKCRPHFLPMEFSSFIITAVYVPPPKQTHRWLWTNFIWLFANWNPFIRRLHSL